MILQNYIEQHRSIIIEIDAIKKFTSSGNITENASEIALHISALAGKIKMHLVNEDKFLYPDLVSRGNPEVSKLAEQYQNEMGGLAEVFIQFKDSYNTKSKIVGKDNELMKSAKAIIEQIEKRIAKEEKELYILID